MGLLETSDGVEGNLNSTGVLIFCKATVIRQSEMAGEGCGAHYLLLTP